MTFNVIWGQGQGEEMISVPYRDYFSDFVLNLTHIGQLFFWCILLFFWRTIFDYFCLTTLLFYSAFSALMLLAGWQEEHPAFKKLSGFLSGVRCRFAYGPADAPATHYLLLQ